MLERSRGNLLDPDGLRCAFTRRPDPSLVADFFEMRDVVEPAIGRLAAAQRDDEQAQRMRDALAIMAARSLRLQAGRDTDRLFHETLLEACGNELMQSLGASIGAAVA